MFLPNLFVTHSLAIARIASTESDAALHVDVDVDADADAMPLAFIILTLEEATATPCRRASSVEARVAVAPDGASTCAAWSKNCRSKNWAVLWATAARAA